MKKIIFIHLNESEAIKIILEESKRLDESREIELFLEDGRKVVGRPSEDVPQVSTSKNFFDETEEEVIRIFGKRVLKKGIPFVVRIGQNGSQKIIKWSLSGE